MAQKPLDKSIVDNIIADWRTGAFSYGQLANKHGVSKAKVGQLCKGIEKDLEPIVDAGTRYKQAILTYDRRIVDAIDGVVDEKMRLIIRRNTIADIAFNRIENELPSCEVVHIKPLIDAADKICVMTEIAPRFSNAVSINNTNAQQNVQPVIMTRVV